MWLFNLMEYSEQVLIKITMFCHQNKTSSMKKQRLIKKFKNHQPSELREVSFTKKKHLQDRDESMHRRFITGDPLHKSTLFFLLFRDWFTSEIIKSLTEHRPSCDKCLLDDRNVCVFFIERINRTRERRTQWRRCHREIKEKTSRPDSISGPETQFRYAVFHGHDQRDSRDGARAFAGPSSSPGRFSLSLPGRGLRIE